MGMVNDETSRILAERSPEKWLEYVLMEAKREYRDARAVALSRYALSGGDVAALKSGKDQRGEPLYDALVSAIQDAAAEYDRTDTEARRVYGAEVTA